MKYIIAYLIIIILFLLFNYAIHKDDQPDGMA